MKLNQLFFSIFIILSFNSKSQETLNYSYCNCLDVIDQLNPVPNGNYTRKCKGTIIEKGQFNSGVKTGEWISYNFEGVIVKKISYLDGILNGDITYFYSTGKIKLKGSFSNGLKIGDWKFYNQNEKIQWTQSYSNGSPIGKSFVYDKKGKKVLVSFDYDKKQYDVKSDDFSLFDKDEEILQDPTTAEWFYLLEADQTEKTKEMKLNQKNFESQILTNLIEIPTETFNTYLNVNYNIELTFENFGVKSINVFREAAKGEIYPLFFFGAMTNDPGKLNKIEPSEFTLLLLDSKIKEVFSIFPPWQIENGQYNIAFLYAINEVEGK
jgi:hypothetical protein